MKKLVALLSFVSCLLALAQSSAQPAPRSSAQPAPRSSASRRSAAQPARPSINFIVTMHHPEEHNFQVTMHIAALPADSIDLCLPVWTPGYYQLMDYARHLDSFSVDGQSGRVRWIKQDSNTWRLYARKGTPLTIRYTIKAEKRFVANPYLNKDHAYILPGAVFLYPKGMLPQPVSIRVIPVPGWTIATGLNRRGNDSGGGGNDSYYARDFDQLYDAPILAGKLETLPLFKVRGIPHTFVGVDLGDFDKTAFIHDLQRIVEAGVDMMGDIPYDHYVFLAIGDGNGGIEHANSCSLSFSGKHLDTEAGRRRMLSFIAHEYYHLYNVKCIRPVELGPFDYQHENRTNLLWVSEGFTVYYEYLLNRRAGLITNDQMFHSLEANIAAYENTTGHLYQSLTEASYATWSYGPFGGSLERSISYYDKGPAVAMLLDLAIRHESANRRSLDDVMVQLYRTFYLGKKRGFSDAEFRQTCEIIAGAPLDEVFSYATTTRDIDYNKYLGYAGLTLDRQDKTFHINPLPATDSLQNEIRDAWLRTGSQPQTSAQPQPGTQPQTSSQPRTGAPHIVNIVNFIRLLEPRDSAITQDVLYQTVASQIRLMRENRLGGTFLLQYDALINPRYQELLKGLPDSNFEIGAWWEITQPHVERAGLHWRGRYPWDSDANVDFSTGYSFKEREKLVDVYMVDFKKIYGHYPASVGSWFIDSYTLDYMYRKYGIVATCNCKDQIGTDGYTLWGGYWNQAYYPSLKNAYMPAQTAAQQLPVPVFRMLGSDPIRQYESGLGSNGQGVITLEPVYPHAGGDEKWIHWYFDQFAHGACMAYAYAQAGQENSFTWPAMEKGLDVQFPLIARLRDSGLVQVETLEQSGRWFKRQFKLTPPTAVTVNDDLNGSDKRTIWFDSRFFRLSILWDQHTLRIRDLHLFDENISDNIKKDSATGSYALLTLPFVDGFVWSDKTHLAGLRLKAVIDGREQELTGGNPVITDSIPGKLHITWPLSETNAAMIIDVDERHLRMHMEQQSVGARAGNQAPTQWWLELTTAPKAALPFTLIDPHAAQARFHGTDYTVHAAQGHFAQPANSGPHREGNGASLKITPEKQSIVLDL